MNGRASWPTSCPKTWSGSASSLSCSADFRLITTLDDLDVEDLVRILREPKNSLIGQYRKLMAYHHAVLEFTDEAVREVAMIAHERGTGARGLRAVIEAVLGPLMFDPQPWTTYFIDEEAVRGGEIATLGLFNLIAASEKPSPAAPLRHKLGRRLAGGS